MSAVLTEVVDDSQLLITLNRPDAKNSVNQELAQGLASALDHLDTDPTLRVGIITGADGGFCAGMDLKAFAAGEIPSIPGRGFAGIVERSADKPLIAAVEGFALAGGLEIALACDLIVAARGAKLGLPETSVGLFAAAGGVMRLRHRVPYAVAMQLALTARPISAEEALHHGLVNELADPGEAVNVARSLASIIAKNAPLGLAASKKMIVASIGRTEDEFWAIQADLQRAVFGSNDAREGALAFAQRRAPQWTGS